MAITISEKKIEDKDQNLLDTLNMVYPVGSIYMSVNSTSPASLFGGTWERIKDRFLLAAGDNYAAGSTGGEAQHTLTVDEMPSHAHKYVADWMSGGGLQEGEPWSLVMMTDKGDGIGYWAFGSDSNHFGWSGGSQPHNNMPPYLVVYVWKRVA